MIKYSKNKKLNTLLQNIEKSLIDNLCIDDLKLYYNTFRNFTRGMPSIAKDTVYQKEFVNQEEYLLYE